MTPALALLPPQLMTTPPLLTMAGVSRRYGDVVALDDVAATLYPGEVLGIVGESGSGKSTLLRMMNLEDAPDAGDYRLALPDAPGNLFDLDRLARRMLRATRIGIVYQNPHQGLLMRNTSSGIALALCWWSRHLEARAMVRVLCRLRNHNTHPATARRGRPQQCSRVRI